MLISRRKEEQNSRALSVSLKEAISDNQGVKSGDSLVRLNSYCSSPSTSVGSSNVTSADNRGFHGEISRFRDKLVRGDEGRTALLDTKYLFKQRESTIFKSFSLNNNIR